MQSEAFFVAALVAERLDRLGIRYVLGGSVASSLMGEPRSTLDVDFVAELPEEKVTSLTEALQKDFYVDESAIREAIRHRSRFNAIHNETVLKVDIFVSPGRPFEKSRMERAAEVNLGENPPRAVRVTSAEDMILAKLEWYREGGEVSQRQWRDILGIVNLQWERLDRDYLSNWAKDLEIDDLLQRAMNEAKSHRHPGGE